MSNSKINQTYQLNGNSSAVIQNVSNRFKYLTILNNTPYSVNVAGDGQDVFTCPIYTLISIPISNEILNNDKINYKVTWTGSGAATLKVVFSEENLSINQTLVTPGGSSSTIVVGDSVGLAKAAQLPTALVGGLLGVALGGSLPAGTNNIGDVDVLSLPAGVLAGMASLPAGTNNIGDVDVLSLPAGVLAGMASLPAGTNNIGDVDVASIAAGDNNIGNVDIVTIGAGEVVKPATTPVIYNVAMTLANTEYSQALPAGCKKFTIGMIEGDTAYRIAFAINKVAAPTAPYIPIAAGGIMAEDNVLLTGVTLYFGCSVAGKNIYILAWT